MNDMDNTRDELLYSLVMRLVVLSMPRNKSRTSTIREGIEMNGNVSVAIALFGIIIGVTATNLVTNETRVIGHQANAVIAECERELPRNEFCELVAVHVEEN